MISLLTLLASIIPFSTLIFFGVKRATSPYPFNIGKTTTICTNIIGTFTKTHPIVKTIFFDDFKVTSEDKDNSLVLCNNITKEEQNIKKDDLKTEHCLKLISIASNFCHYEKLRTIESTTLNFLSSLGITRDISLNEYSKIQEIELQKDKKISTTVIIHNESKEIFSFSKGNSYKILERCSKIILGGKKENLTPELKRKIKNRIDKLNKAGQKVIAFAYKGLPLKRLDQYADTFVEKEMTFIGMVGITEALNTEIQREIKLAKENNIKIYILTGIEEKKAVAVAQKLQIVNQNYFEAINGEELQDFNDKKFEKIFSNTEKDYIFSELKQGQKELLMKLIKQSGQHVIFTEKSEKNNFQATVQNIVDARKKYSKEQAILTHSIPSKIALTIITLTAITLKAPIAISLGAILIIDLIINFLLEAGMKKEYIKEHQLEKTSIITSGILIGMFITTIYIWTLVKHGWYFGEKMASQNISAISSTSAFLLLSFIQILRAFKLQKPNIYLWLKTIVIITFIYGLLTLAELTAVLNLKMPSLIEFNILLFSCFIIVLLNFGPQLIRKFLPKNESTNQN